MSLKEKFSVGDLVSFIIPGEEVVYFGIVRFVEDDVISVESPSFNRLAPDNTTFGPTSLSEYRLQRIDTIALLAAANESSYHLKVLWEESKKAALDFYRREEDFRKRGGRIMESLKKCILR